jgi:glutamyl-tRNA reductase
MNATCFRSSSARSVWPAKCAEAQMRDPRSVDGMRNHELDRALRLLRRGENPARVVDELSRRLMNKLIHAPTKGARDAA